MKERIVIKDEFWVKHFQEREKDFYEEDLCSGGNPEEWWHYEKEQVPETFEELKELCINLKRDYDITCVSSTIWVHGLSFNETGIIGDSHHSLIVEDKTPAQMWAIIKNLVGDM